MLPLDYAILRLIRRWLPPPAMRFLMRRRWLVQPGMETRDPATAIARYERLLGAYRSGWEGATVFILGYGGFLHVGVELLRRGAAHVILYDPYAPLDHARNVALLPHYARYLSRRGDEILPNPTHITLLEGPLPALVAVGRVPALDIVLSSSVYEHIAAEEITALTRALAASTAPTGIHLHIVDLRDHFFKYPFQMLTFSESTWRRWFNPPSNLNRWRLHDYRDLFERTFAEVHLLILERDVERFRRVRGHIRPEFLTGDETLDAVTKIAVIARNPLPLVNLSPRKSPHVHTP